VKTEKDEKNTSYAKALLKTEPAAPPMEKIAENASSPPPGFDSVAVKTVSVPDVERVCPETENPAAKPEKSGVETGKIAPKTAPIATNAPYNTEINKNQENIMDKNQKTEKPVMKHKQVTINLSQENVNRGDSNKKKNINLSEIRQQQSYKKSSQENAQPMPQPIQGAFYPPQMMPQMAGPGQMPGQMPGMQVVYMMPTAAGGFQPVMAAPPGWQMAPQMAQGMPQMMQGMQPMQAAMGAPMGMQPMPMTYAPVQHVQYFQEVPQNMPVQMNYGPVQPNQAQHHGHRKSSVGQNTFNPTFNPLKQAAKDKRNHSNNSGSHSHGSHSHGSHSHSNGSHSHGRGSDHSTSMTHHNKDNKKKSDITSKKTKSVETDSAQNARTNSSGSDLSLGCSASQNGSGARCMRSCSHDSGVSHKTPETTSQRNNSHGSCDGKTSIAATVNGDASVEARNLSVNSDGTPRRRFSNQTEFKKPESELVVKIIELIEFYLSDEYLAKDKYLLRQIRCKSEGYISIKLMTSFKKVKKLTRDWRSVRYALLKSKNLEISPEGFRVKRASALPDALRKPRLLSSVVSIRLPLEYQSVDAITQLFSKYGEIGLVRLLKPGKEIPSDLRNYATQVPDIGKSLCAVVDFEQSDAALQAVRCLKEQLVESGMRLALLGPRVRRTLYKQDRPEDESVCDAESVCDENVGENGKAESEIEKAVVKTVKIVETERRTTKESEAGATTETPETEVEPPTEGIFRAKKVYISDNQKTENLKIKSKVSIILREPKCPSQLNNGFNQVRTAIV